MTTPAPATRRHAAPAAIEVEEFARARVKELSALRTAILAGRGNRRVHQQLSWHLRRRTLSHSSRRAPASIRIAHQRELAAAGLTSDRASGPRGSRRLRKYRARARFLQSMRKLRNARPSRLETHEWHAKRFRMDHVSAVPGRLAALRCNDRGLRSAFRAVTHSSAAHDASYLDVVEIIACTHDTLITALSAVLAKADAARIASERVAAGARTALGVVVLDPVIQRVIAPVDVLFRPSRASTFENSPSATAWLWAHPAASHAIATVLSTNAPSPPTVTVSVLRNELQTLRILGPRAGFVLGAVINRSDTSTKAWDVIRHARSPASSPACAVLTGEMHDPRATFPPKRVQAMATAYADDAGVRALVIASADAFETPVSDSPIWDSRAACTPRGCGVKDSMQTLPFLLLQRPGKHDRGLGAGWDLVVPRGWGRPLWHSLMYANGARALGTLEMKHIALETDQITFPHDFPDSLYANVAFREVEAKLGEKFESRPKSKRVNYQLYRVRSPFYPDFAAVDAPMPVDACPSGGADGSATTSSKSQAGGNAIIEKFGTMDDGQKKASEDGKTVVRRPRKRQRVVVPVSELTDEKMPFRVVRVRVELRKMLGLSATSDLFAHRVRVSAGASANMQIAESTPLLCDEPCFTRALIEPVGRGTVVMNALICAPLDEDLKQAVNGNLKQAPKEKLRRRREDVLPSRRCIGRVIHGDFSMARGAPAAVAFVKIDDVRTLLSDSRALPRQRRGHVVQVRVLVRNIDSLQYRFATATLDV